MSLALQITEFVYPEIKLAGCEGEKWQLQAERRSYHELSTMADAKAISVDAAIAERKTQKAFPGRSTLLCFAPDRLRQDFS